MTAALLDVNLLLALCDPRHAHHEPAHRWFAATGKSAWATCPLTENAFIRIAGQPTYPNSPGGTPAVAALLKSFCRHRGHRFWPDAVSLRDEALFKLDRALAPNQTTDIYLLGLAVKHGGTLATFDGSIPAAVVIGGERALALVMA